MADFDPSLIFGDEPVKLVGGIRKMCSDHKRCGIGISCEHAQVRNEACEVMPLWIPSGGDGKGCENWTPRAELASENDQFARDRLKHNPLRRSNNIKIPEHLKKGPDLLVKRHIRDGRNIKGED